MTTPQITCAYSITAVGSIPIDPLAARFAAVPLRAEDITAIGLLVNSDSTEIDIGGASAVRIIVLDVAPDFIVNFPDVAGWPSAVANWMTLTLTAAMRSPVTAYPPVVTTPPVL